MQLDSQLAPPPALSRRAIRAEPVPMNWDPTLPVFAKQEFLAAVGDEHGWLAGVDGAGELRCLLPYTIVRKAGLRMVRFRVETIPRGAGLDVDEEKSFLNSVVEYFRKIRADVIIPASTNTIFRTYPGGSLAAPYGTHFIDLTKPEEALFAAMSSNHRRHVRSAEKSGIQVRLAPECLTTAHSIVQDTFKKSSMPFMSPESFTRMMRGLGENGHVFVAEHEGQVQCCAAMAFSGHSAYYMYGGSIPEAVPGAMHLLHWEAIRSYRQMGVRRYDFCGARIDPAPGSKAAGLATFKQRFGASLSQGYMWKFRISTLKSAVYTVAVRFLRGGDIVDAEHHKLPTQQITEVDSTSLSSSPAGTAKRQNL